MATEARRGGNGLDRDGGTTLRAAVSEDPARDGGDAVPSNSIDDDDTLDFLEPSDEIEREGDTE